LVIYKQHAKTCLPGFEENKKRRGFGKPGANMGICHAYIVGKQVVGLTDSCNGAKHINKATISIIV